MAKDVQLGDWLNERADRRDAKLRETAQELTRIETEATTLREAGLVLRKKTMSFLAIFSR